MPPSPSSTELTPRRIEEAEARIDPVFKDTPQYLAEAASERLGFELLVKVETANPIRSFKGRGASLFVGEVGAGPLVCASAGNFGQGLAYAARARGLSLTVFAAETANSFKLERMRSLGAEVRLAGADFDAAKAAAREHAAAVGAAYVEDGREPAIAAGAGTIALELGRLPHPLDAVLIPLGNGALINGMGCWLKAHAPATRVIGVAAAGAPAMALSFEERRVVETESVATIADGVAVRVPVPEALAEMRRTVDEVLLVEDAAILRAMRQAHIELGLVVEPAGAIGLAAAEVFRQRFHGQRVATVLCGGNLTPEQIREWLVR